MRWSQTYGNFRQINEEENVRGVSRVSVYCYMKHVFVEGRNPGEIRRERGNYRAGDKKEEEEKKTKMGLQALYNEMERRGWRLRKAFAVSDDVAQELITTTVSLLLHKKDLFVGELVAVGLSTIILASGLGGAFIYLLGKPEINKRRMVQEKQRERERERERL
uniref:Uncharacterized protein n=1 Tax=Nelumbo nucifera TaxID=4432 RepID=A0A822XH29_NELNU|nr:TPA_asm: hypothetical protein HUJ06_020436 [Nelumbo nucifera]